MVNLNKSFLYGICFASLTWIISLYLYFQITNSEISANNVTHEFHPSTANLNKTSNSNKNHEKLLQKIKPFRNKHDTDEGNKY